MIQLQDLLSLDSNFLNTFYLFETINLCHAWILRLHSEIILITQNVYTQKSYKINTFHKTMYHYDICISLLKILLLDRWSQGQNYQQSLFYFYCVKFHLLCYMIHMFFVLFVYNNNNFF